jgi:thiosulfate dehydrogenase
MSEQEQNSEERYIEIIQRLVKTVVVLILIIIALIALNIYDLTSPPKKKKTPIEYVPPKTDTTTISADTLHATSPDTSLIKNEKNAELISYGRELIAHTSDYLGPKGKVAKLSNGMNCQNCHLDAGTKAFGNNYLGVAPTYPKFRERSGSIETIFKRVSDCFERSLNGRSPDTTSKEMLAIKEYVLWLGKDMEKGKKPKGSGIVDLAFMDRAADPEKGKTIYSLKCKTCHGEHGDGKMNENGLSYQYPPLWGENSYNNGAGLYRLSRFAGYVKYNMPQNASFKNIQLTDEEAWDVAAFVNSQDRPTKDLSKDWPKTEGKPVDHPFGPFADKFSEEQHKYGPFKEIAAEKKKKKGKS